VVLTGFLCFQISLFHLLPRQQVSLVQTQKYFMCRHLQIALSSVPSPTQTVALCLYMMSSSPFLSGSGICEHVPCTYKGVIRTTSSLIDVCCAFASPLVDDLQCISTFSHPIFIPCPSPFLSRACSCTPTGIRIIHRASFVFICATLLPLGFRSSQHSFTPPSTAHPSLCALLTWPKPCGPFLSSCFYLSIFQVLPTIMHM